MNIFEEALTLLVEKRVNEQLQLKVNTNTVSSTYTTNSPNSPVECYGEDQLNSILAEMTKSGLIHKDTYGVGVYRDSNGNIQIADSDYKSGTVTKREDNNDKKFEKDDFGLAGVAIKDLSSFVGSYSFVKEKCLLFIELSSKWYIYTGVPYDIFRQFSRNSSKGQFYNKHIKRQYKSKLLNTTI